jgi:hypothetical protein
VLWTGPHDGSLNGQSTTVAVDQNTQVTGPGHASEQLSDIQTGDLVAVRAVGIGQDLSSLTAVQVRVYCNCHWVGGTIESVGSDSVSVEVARTGPYDTVLAGQTVTIDVNGSTQYLEGRDKSPIGLDDLSNGEKVGIVFSANGFFKAPGFDPSNATFTATRVHAWEGKQVPFASSDGSALAQTTP